MPTKNPKVSGYVPQVLKDRLAEFQEEQGGISESQAITIVLSEYFGIEQKVKKSAEGVSVGGITLSRIETIEDRLTRVEQIVDLSSSPLITTIDVSDSASASPVENSENRSELLLEPPSNFVPVPGVKLSSLRFGLNRSSVASAKKSKSTEKFTEWTKEKDPDGISWKYVEEPSKGYIPVSELPSELWEKLDRWIAENL